jgi:carbonic anhydrase
MAYRRFNSILFPNGQHGVMALHAVFADPKSDGKAVVGMLYSIGKKNSFLAELLVRGLPSKTGNEVTYPGSLTTPPSSGTVTWFVAPGTLPSCRRSSWRRSGTSSVMTSVLCRNSTAGLYTRRRLTMMVI